MRSRYQCSSYIVFNSTHVYRFDKKNLIGLEILKIQAQTHYVFKFFRIHWEFICIKEYLNENVNERVTCVGT